MGLCNEKIYDDFTHCIKHKNIVLNLDNIFDEN